jgi:hypothetical protein
MPPSVMPGFIAPVVLARAAGWSFGVVIRIMVRMSVVGAQAGASVTDWVTYAHWFDFLGHNVVLATQPVRHLVGGERHATQLRQPVSSVGASGLSRLAGVRPDDQGGLKCRPGLLVLIVVLVIVFGGGGYYASGNYGPYYGGGVSLVGILVIILVVMLLSGWRP